MKRLLKLSLVTFLSCHLNLTVYAQKANTNYVPDSATAIKIAEAVWLPIYGPEVFEYKPYNVALMKNKVWIVRGVRKKGIGGYPYIEIQKSDGKILRVTHTK